MFIVLAGRLQQLEDNVKVPSKPDAQHCQKRLPDELHIDPGHRHDPECGSWPPGTNTEKRIFAITDGPVNCDKVLSLDLNHMQQICWVQIY